MRIGDRLAGRGGDIVVVAVLGAAVAAFALAPEHPAPPGVVLNGAVLGLRVSLVAAAILLVYRSSRAINFAAAALGGVAGILVPNLSAIGIGDLKLPVAVSIPVALAFSLVVGAAFELAFARRFARSPRVVLTMVTVIAMPTLSVAAGKMTALPFWSHGPHVEELRQKPSLFHPIGGELFRLAPVTFDVPKVAGLVVPVLLLGALGAVLRWTRLGAALRGAAENPDRALLLGVNVGLLSTTVWAVAAFLSTAAAVLTGLDSGTYHNGAGGTDVSGGLVVALLPALVAVGVARLRSLPVAAFAAVALSVLSAQVDWSVPGQPVFSVLLLLVLVAALLLQRPSYSRDERALATAWEGATEVRPTPREVLAVPSIRYARRAAAALALAGVVLFPQVMSLDQSRVASIVAMNVILALSLVVMTGWGGQISLGQIAFFGIAAFAGAALVQYLHLSFWLALPVASVATALVAVAVGTVALRVRGPFLPVVTLVLAYAWYDVAFQSTWLDRFRADKFDRPHLFFVSLRGERAYYYLCAAFAVASIWLVRRLRAGRVGRLLLAIRDDEYGVAPFGVSAARTRTAVFALSGLLAGVAGVLYVFSIGLVPAQSSNVPNFGVGDSIDVFVMVVVGGLASVSGAVLGAVYVGVSKLAITDNELRRFTTDTGLLALLLVSPGGLSQLLYGARDAVLRLVALRRRIPVPSLFANRDIGDVLAQRTALAPGDPDRGLGALPPGRRYALPSAVHRTRKAAHEDPLTVVVGR